MCGSYTLINPFLQPLPFPHLITQPQEQQGHAGPPQQAHDTEEGDEVSGLEQDCGVRSGDEPRASPQPAHADCKLLPCSTASSSEDSSLILFHLPACSGQSFPQQVLDMQLILALGPLWVSFQFKEGQG